MLEYFIITHKTQDNDIVYYNQRENIFIDTIEMATWYDNKVEALLTCRKYLRSYLNITIKNLKEM